MWSSHNADDTNDEVLECSPSCAQRGVIACSSAVTPNFQSEEWNSNWTWSGRFPSYPDGLLGQLVGHHSRQPFEHCQREGEVGVGLSQL
jgi:hypothetical protein